ncbi:MAG: hypothetical protein QNJ63_01800 [Calothrix sp. MO_192.B10]|nr:hypothetical protein [Calothrix sp. MO_192.B10]
MSIPPSQKFTEQYNIENPDSEIDETTTSPPNTDIDLEFIFTRDIKSRQETIYFIVGNRFFDGDHQNNYEPHPEFYEPNQERGMGQILG